MLAFYIELPPLALCTRLSISSLFPHRTRAARIDNFVTTLLSLHRQFQWPLPTKGGISLSPPAPDRGKHDDGFMLQGSSDQDGLEDANRLVDHKAVPESECHARCIYVWQYAPATGSNYAIAGSNYKRSCAIAGSDHAIVGRRVLILISLNGGYCLALVMKALRTLLISMCALSVYLVTLTCLACVLCLLCTAVFVCMCVYSTHKLHS